MDIVGYKLTEEQKKWLEYLIESDTLDTILSRNEPHYPIWWNFQESFSISELKLSGRYWSQFDIKAKLSEIIISGKYTRQQRKILKSVATYVLNKKEIHKVNKLWTIP